MDIELAVWSFNCSVLSDINERWQVIMSNNKLCYLVVLVEINNRVTQPGY